MESHIKELDEGDLYLIHEAVEIYYSKVCSRLEKHASEGFALYDKDKNDKTINWFNVLTKTKKRLASIRNCLQSEIDRRLEEEGGGDWVAM